MLLHVSLVNIFVVQSTGFRIYWLYSLLRGKTFFPKTIAMGPKLNRSITGSEAPVLNL